MDPARREALRILPELLEAGLDQAHLVLVVVDRERRAVAEPLRFAPEHAAAGSVEGEDPDRARGCAEHPLEALSHLPRGLVRERDREDLVRANLQVVDEMGDAVGEDARLSRARAGDHEQRPFGVLNRLALRLVEDGELGLGLRDGHLPMLAAASVAYEEATVGVRPARGDHAGDETPCARAALATRARRGTGRLSCRHRVKWHASARAIPSAVLELPAPARREPIHAPAAAHRLPVAPYETTAYRNHAASPVQYDLEHAHGRPSPHLLGRSRRPRDRSSATFSADRTSNMRSRRRGGSSSRPDPASWAFTRRAESTRASPSPIPGTTRSR